jgi:hypothetical protein
MAEYRRFGNGIGVAGRYEDELWAGIPLRAYLRKAMQSPDWEMGKVGACDLVGGSHEGQDTDESTDIGSANYPNSSTSLAIRVLIGSC